MQDLTLNSVFTDEHSTIQDRKLSQTHDHAMVSMAFTLDWNSDYAQHTDSFVVQKLNLWRDILPSKMDRDLINKPAGYAATATYGAGELVTETQTKFLFDIDPGCFNRHFRKCYIEPRQGRFYPRGFITGVADIFAEDLRPFRVAEVSRDYLLLDLNHSLAENELSVKARIIDIWEGSAAERGGFCQDIAEIITQNGPGMQARWHTQPTDFWSDTPFLRTDPSSDEAFYKHPRLVQHVDSLASKQIGQLYEQLLPRTGKVLDLMSSWTSHITTDLDSLHFTGLGMNPEELAANPLLNEWQVEDLNLRPRLPFADHSFDAVICSLSVEYLSQPLAIFNEARRVLHPGKLFILTFSDRWFPPKVVKVWQDCHEFERMGLVLEYFLKAGGFSGLRTWSMRGLPRPEDDKYATSMALSDPVYAVWGTKNQ